MGREKESVNKSSYKSYVESLRKSGQRFPVNDDGAPNFSEIARQCGFYRQVLYNNKKLKELFKKDLAEIGLEGSNFKSTSAVESTKKTEKKCSQSIERGSEGNELNAFIEQVVQEIESTGKRYF